MFGVDDLVLYLFGEVAKSFGEALAKDVTDGIFGKLVTKDDLVAAVREVEAIYIRSLSIWKTTTPTQARCTRRRRLRAT